MKLCFSYSISTYGVLINTPQNRKTRKLLVYQKRVNVRKMGKKWG